MKLGIDQLEKSGSFTGPPVEKEIEWDQNGETLKATAFIRKMSYKTAVTDLSSKGLEMVASRIASCICDENGKAVFTVEDITGEADPERGPLNHNLTVKLLNAIVEVNTPGKPEK